MTFFECSHCGEAFDIDSTSLPDLFFCPGCNEQIEKQTDEDVPSGLIDTPTKAMDQTDASLPHTHSKTLPLPDSDIEVSDNDTLNFHSFAETRIRSGDSINESDISSSFDFSLLEKIGEGGMAVVYSATQSSLKREVAIKMLKNKQTSSSVEQFTAEAMVLGELDHPNIVPVHMVGRDQNKRIFFAMKKVLGQPWHYLLNPSRIKSETKKAEIIERATSMSLVEHLDIFQKICDAVAFAHSKGIIHRDLKPENVMVGAFGEVLLMDWGLAADTQDETREYRKGIPKIEISGIAGTPAYMAPEQVSCKGEDLGDWTDIYQLGGILYEILTKHPPHNIKTDKWKDAIKHIEKGIITPPSERAPDEIIPVELENIVLKALSPDPEDRYQSVMDIQIAVSHFLSGEANRNESVEIAEAVEMDFNSLKTKIISGRETVDEYNLLAELQAKIQHSIALWQKNRHALVLGVKITKFYSEKALTNGDLLLARTQVRLLKSLMTRKNSSKERNSFSLQGVLDIEERIDKEQQRRKAKIRSFRIAVAGVIILVISTLFALSRVESEKEKTEKAEEIASSETQKRKAIQAQHKRHWKNLWETEFDNEFEPRKITTQITEDITRTDIELGPWILTNTRSLQNETAQGRWAQFKDNKLFIHSEGEVYLYLNKSLFGNLRLNVTAYYVEGSHPEITIFLSGSRKNQEYDGYTLAVGPRVKLQRKGLTLAEKDLPAALKAGQVINIRLERKTDTLSCYVNDMQTPVIVWRDPAPLWGKKNDICGFYVYQGTVAIEAMTIEKLAWAEKTTPLDFANGLAERGFLDAAISEYKEVALSMKTPTERAVPMFRMGQEYARAKKDEKAKEIFERFVTGKAPEQDLIKVDYTKNKPLVSQAYAELAIMEFKKIRPLPKMDASTWSPEYREIWENLNRNCKNTTGAERLFHYFMLRLSNSDASNSVDRINNIFLLSDLLEWIPEKNRKGFAVGLSREISMIGINGINNFEIDIYIAVQTKAIEMNPYSVPAHMARFKAYERQGDFDKAFKDIEKAMELNPQSSAPLIAGATMCTRAVQYERGMKYINKALELDPENAHAQQIQKTLEGCIAREENK